MPKKSRRTIVALLCILGLTTLSCKAVYYVLNGEPSDFPSNVSGVLCYMTNGTWIDHEDGTGECDRTHSQAAGNEQQDGQGTGADQQNGQGAGNDQQSVQGHIFSLDDCSCAGVNVPLRTDLSSAGNYSSSKTLSNGERIRTTGDLICDWEEGYQSANRTGTILLYLTVAKLDDVAYASDLTTILQREVTDMPQYCEDDSDCTVAVTEFSGARSFYAWKEILTEPDGTVFPSGHFADLVRLVDTGNDDVFYVIDLKVSHPELEMGDNWEIDVSRSIEACVMDFAK